jgi:phosphatidylglycerophosphate synthase
MTKAGSGPGQPLVEAKRVVAGVTAPWERRALAWLAPRVPAAVTSDHLTLLGLGATVACGALYAASSARPGALWLVNLGLALNWLGDSLDGSLARYRRCERPRFGFYVDHLADAFGALFLLGGLGASGLMSPLVAAGLLAAYFLLGIQTYLATYAIGRFKVSWGPVGGTELRLVLVALNAVAVHSPRFALAGRSWLLFDVVGTAAAAALVVVATIAGVRGTLALAREEGWAPASPSRGGPVASAARGPVA